jgi:hypothetical protein
VILELANRILHKPKICYIPSGLRMVADVLEDALAELEEHRDAPEFAALIAAARAGDAAPVLAWLEARGLCSRFDDLVRILGHSYREAILELALPGVVFAGDVRVLSCHTSESGRARGAWAKREQGDLDIDLWFGWPGAIVTVFTAAGARALGRLAAADRARVVGLDLWVGSGLEKVEYGDVAGLAEGAWPALRRLSIHSAAAQSVAAELIGHSPELVELDPGGALSTAAIEKVAAAQMLRSLELYNPVEDELARLAALPRVSSLRIEVGKARRFSTHGLDHLARWPALRELRTDAIGDQDVAALATVRGIERLLLLGSKVSDVGGPALARLDRLRELGLSHTRVGDATAAALAVAPALETLCLTDTRVGPAGILALARAPRLRRLGLSWDCGPDVSAAAKQAFAPGTIFWSDYYNGGGMFSPAFVP